MKIEREKLAVKDLDVLTHTVGFIVYQLPIENTGQSSLLRSDASRHMRYDTSPIEHRRGTYI